MAINMRPADSVHGPDAFLQVAVSENIIPSVHRFGERYDAS